MALEKIDQYRIIRKIGSGGMGDVYLCEDEEFDRKVALKVMNDSKSNDLVVDRERFTREAMTTAQLQHPGIPAVFDLSKTESGSLYYAMKLIEGMSLNEILVRLEKGDTQYEYRYPMNRLIEIFRDVCRILEYVHNNSYIHRDLKPSNIFIGDYGEVYIIDWGLTKKIKQRAFDDDQESDTTIMMMPDGLPSKLSPAEPAEVETEMVIVQDTEDFDDDSNLTRQGSLVGTPAYMSPEQVRGDFESMYEESDIYALGVILYRILSLRLPTKGLNFKNMMQVKLKGQILPPEQVSPERDIPPELSAIAMQAMSTKPEERFGSVSRLTQSVEFWLEGKTQFRTSELGDFNESLFRCIPETTRDRWITQDKMVRTQSKGKGEESFFLFNRFFYGDLKINMNLRVLPLENKNEVMRDFGIIFKASTPVDGQKDFDHYAVRFAVNNNTRLVLTKNGNELAANEYVVLESNRKYSISIEFSFEWIHVRLDKHLILSYQDRRPLTGTSLGFVHMGHSVIYNRVNVSVRGRHLKAQVIDIPEALMAEGCHDGARKRFMDIYRNHKSRFVGLWAAYRAGVASYRHDGSYENALEIFDLFKDTRYPMLKEFGLARIALLRKDYREALSQLEKIVETSAPDHFFVAVADLVFEHTQKLLMKAEPEQYKVLDGWVHLTMALDKKISRHDTLTISIIWRWIFSVATKDVSRLPYCIECLREIYGTDQGEFQEIFTTPTLLYKIIKRTSELKDHSFLLDKIMRLIVLHNDPIGDLETLGRYYLISGYEKIAMQVFQQIIRINRHIGARVPPSPAAFVACRQWILGKYSEARNTFIIMSKHCDGWGHSDGLFFLGLDDYRQGKKVEAYERWQDLYYQYAATDIRRFIAKGLMGDIPYDPDEAGVPDRSDYRMLYCLFVGFRAMLDWRESRDQKDAQIATFLFEEALRLRKPSHDIYASTDTFFMAPLELIQGNRVRIESPAPLDLEEKEWIRSLIKAVSTEMIKDEDA